MPWDYDPVCRQCSENDTYVWIRLDLYNFHMNNLHGQHTYCPVCGRCQCGMRPDWTEPPSGYTPI